MSRLTDFCLPENYNAFLTSWKNVYNAISDNDKIYMFWSPNVDTSSEPVAPWWPGKEYVSRSATYSQSAQHHTDCDAFLKKKIRYTL